MKHKWQWPSVRAAAIVASMLAVVSFFFMPDYWVGRSFIVNVMHGHSFGGVPYRLILALLAAFVGIVALKQSKT